MGAISERTYSKMLKRVTELGHRSIRDAVIEQYQTKGRPISEVAVVMGVAPDTMDRVMKELQIPARKRRGRR